MKQKIKVDPFLKRQPQKLFVEELKKPVHAETPKAFNVRAVEKGEMNVVKGKIDIILTKV